VYQSAPVASARTEVRARPFVRGVLDCDIHVGSFRSAARVRTEDVHIVN
jgi:hypothetical protein